MQSVDLILKNASQLITCASQNQPKRGGEMRDIGVIEGGAIAIEGGKIVAVGDTASITGEYSAGETVDVGGKTVIPGLVDCHTHVPHAGNRYGEFEMRIQGQSYMEIMNAGGGIMSTVRATRSASLDDLIALTHSRLNDMMKLGTTTAELKTGYGLSAEAESTQMQAILTVAEEHPMTLVPTYLGAHTKPPEYDTTAEYLQTIFDESLPRAQEAYARSATAQKNIPLFVDIFVEKGVFSVEDMIAYFEFAREQGIPLKAHLDQFENMGGVPIAIKMGAVSVDHLEVTPPHELDVIAQSETVGVMLPTVNFNLGLMQFGNARHLIDRGGILALATDYNPGSSPTISLPLVMAIACRYQKLLPAEALNACTINAAVALNVADRVGSLESGKQADLVVLDTPDYRGLMVEFGRNFVEQVYIKGERRWTRSS